MTQDQHDSPLTRYYNERIEKAKSYLQERYLIEEVAIDDDSVSDLVSKLPKEYPESQFWKVEIEGSWRKFKLIVVIPKTFPDGFPRLYLEKDDSANLQPLPHVDHNRFICTRDPSVVVINDECPGEAIEQLLQIAIKEIIEPGIKRENSNDLIDEFLAYWEEDCQFSMLTASKPGGNKLKVLECFDLPRHVVDSQYIISSSVEEASRWAAPYGMELSSSQGDKIVYIPLPDRFSPEVFLARKGIALSILRNLPSSYTLFMERFFNEDRDSYNILCSFPLGSDHVLFGWRHKRWKDIKGFSRRNHIPLKIRLVYARDEDIEKIKIIRVDKERIFRRAGIEGDSLKNDISVAIVGCGSIGGFLSMSLARYGVTKFLLIDSQLLKLENIGRHLCGFADASARTTKVDAVKKALHNQFPGIECAVYSEEVLSLFLKSGGELLHNYDLLILATADQAVERRISYLMKRKEISCPVVCLWLEPFGVAGHLLYMNPHSEGCYQCCLDANGFFMYSVAGPDQQLSRRESGCQTVYSPIASIDTERFVGLATKQILELIRNHRNSTLYTWLGDIDAFRARGYKLNDIYVADFSGSLIVREIVAKEACPICKEGRAG